MLRTVYDPEIPVNIYDLGLIYNVDIQEEGAKVVITMTLTAPNCPAADFILQDVQIKVESIKGVKRCDIELTFDPPWDSSMMSEEAQLDREDVILAMEAGAEVESLYSSSGQEDGSELCLADRVVAAAHGCVGASMGSSSAVENDVEKDRLLDQMLLAQLLGELPERDRELIRMRYFQNKTQTEIAGILGISQVQVSRLEKKILREMREMAG